MDFFDELFLRCFCYVCVFLFNIWHAVVANLDGVTVEQFTKFVTWGKVLSYKNQEIISDFRFGISTKLRVKSNNISFSVSFVVADIFV